MAQQTKENPSNPSDETRSLMDNVLRKLLSTPPKKPKPKKKS